MDDDFEGQGQLLLLGRPLESLPLLKDFLPSRRCSMIRTVDAVEVETLASVLKPGAILLEASDLYLEGRTILSRLKELSEGSRVIFLDVEGPWGLFMEFISDHTNDLRILPCTLDGLGETLMTLLESGKPEPEVEPDDDFSMRAEPCETRLSTSRVC